MNRTLKEMTDIAEYIRINRDKLSDEEILEIGKGVKHCPISQCETCSLGFDGLHCLLSCGRWLIKIIERFVYIGTLETLTWRNKIFVG